MYSRFKCARRHELSDQNNTFLPFTWCLPGVIEADNVRMLETLQHPSLLFKALTLRLGQFTILYTGQRRKISHRSTNSFQLREEVFTYKQGKLTVQHHYSECGYDQNKQGEIWRGGDEIELTDKYKDLQKWERERDEILWNNDGTVNKG